MKASLLLAGVFACASLSAQDVTLQLVATASAPVDIDNAGDDRLFVTERAGRIRILRPDGTFDPIPFLDISDRVNSSGGEQGLLGLTFDPQYATNGYFYVNYIHGQGNGSTHISRFSVTQNPDLASAASESIIFSVPQPATNHNGGDLTFGPDGYLWFALGDGGGAGDPLNNAQNMTSPHGKMLRIDVHGAAPYSIPADNPFANGDPAQVLPEIWASGLRNPFRFSFDALTNDLYISDVGQSAYEEINFLPAGSSGGANFGWRCFEGPAPYDQSQCDQLADHTLPVHAYPHGAGACSVIGGYVYRGDPASSLYGMYLYTDFCLGQLHGLVQDPVEGWVSMQLTESHGFGFAAMGVDQNGELYICKTTSGQIYRIMASPAQSVSLDVRSFLQGAFDEDDGLMRDDLRVNDLLPLTEPYTAMGHTPAGDGGGESVGAALLDITGPQAVVDWVRVELRDAVDPGDLMATRHALLRRNGNITMADGSIPVTFNVPSGEYHVVVRHRNHLAVRTASPLMLNGSPAILDLRDPSTPVHGTDARLISGTSAMLWAGDVNQDAQVKYAGSGNDRDAILVSIGGIIPTAETIGYMPEDVNMDGTVRYTGSDNDRDIILMNIGGVIPNNVLHGHVP
jgi:glucose/arabinose dehydrogenase